MTVSICFYMYMERGSMKKRIENVCVEKWKCNKSIRGKLDGMPFKLGKTKKSCQIDELCMQENEIEKGNVHFMRKLYVELI